MWKRIRSFYPVGANQPEAIRDNRNPTPTKKAPEGATGTTPQEVAEIDRLYPETLTPKYQTVYAGLWLKLSYCQ